MSVKQKAPHARRLGLTDDDATAAVLLNNFGLGKTVLMLTISEPNARMYAAITMMMSPSLISDAEPPTG